MLLKNVLNPIPHGGGLVFQRYLNLQTFFLPKLPCKLVLRMYLYFWKVSKPNPP